MVVSNGDEAIRVEGVTKVYRVYDSPMDRVRRLVGRPGRFLDFAALQDVSVRVPKGEALGIIGENGAGKSTLLKIISGTTAPTLGTVEVDGTVAAILELGAAFHPEFSGRENAILYGALMGFSRTEMERRIEPILAFAELGEFIDHPLKTYSTGMAMRLGFAVATNVEPDVLVVDEALAVGDGYFQKKCVDKILEIKERGTTIFFCSHSMYFVTMFCDRALWLDHGRVRAEGPAKEVVEGYEAHLLQRGKRRLSAREGGVADAAPASTVGTQVGRISRVRIEGAGEGQPVQLRPHDRLAVQIEVESARAGERFHLGISLDAPDGMVLLAVSTLWDGRDPLSGAERYTVRLTVPDLPVARGRYLVSAFLLDETGLCVHDQVAVTEAVQLDGERWSPGLIDMPRRWDVL